MIRLACTDDSIILQRMPLWVGLIDYLFLEKLCRVPGDLWCCRGPHNRLMDFVERRTVEFNVPTPKDTISPFKDWAKWPIWEEEEDDDE